MNKNKSKPSSWYVFYCRSRAEKKAFAELIFLGFKAYLPLVLSERAWSDRIKKLKLPMFPGYIFVFCTEFEIFEVMQISQVLAVVKIDEKPAKLTEKEVELMRIVEKNGLYYSTEKSNVKNGDVVEVVMGPLRGYVGQCIEDKGKFYFLIAIQGVDMQLKLKIGKNAVKIIS